MTNKGIGILLFKRLNFILQKYTFLCEQKSEFQNNGKIWRKIEFLVEKLYFCTTTKLKQIDYLCVVSCNIKKIKL